MSTRTLQAKLAQFIEIRLTGNPAYLQALAARDARTIFRLAGETLEGIRETTDNAGPLVELIQRTLGGADKEPWCMSLVQSCLAFAELKTGLRSPIHASEHCMTVWRNTPAAQRVQTIPAVGAIIIWRHGSTDSGHTGITIAPVAGRTFRAIEGNTSSGVVGGKIERDGGGVYRTERSLDGAGNMRIVGFLKPF